MHKLKIHLYDRNNQGKPEGEPISSFEVSYAHAEIKNTFAKQAGEPEGKKVDAFFVIVDSEIKNIEVLKTKNIVVFEYEDKKYIILNVVYRKGFYSSHGTYEFKCYSA